MQCALLVRINGVPCVEIYCLVICHRRFTHSLFRACKNRLHKLIFQVNLCYPHDPL